MDEAEMKSVPQKVTRRVGSFFGKVNPDAWVVSLAIILASLFVVAAVQQKPAPGAAKAGDAKQAVANAPKDDTSGTVSIDNDPYLGDKKTAKVAIVEFSDFECPFCKKFHADTFQPLVDKYVKTGQAILVFRDLPLSFHEPVASESAGIANCVFQTKGSEAYFKIAQGLYADTLANGKGLPAGKIDQLLQAVGVNVVETRACAATEETKAEIAKDAADGAAVGIGGTPSFVVGKLDADGMVTGEVVVGAQPLAAFEQTLATYLK
jgi:protein-disulfide isomerase